MASSSLSRQEIVKYHHQQERSIASSKLYDAFISHRGPDVKDTLAKQIYDLLKDRGCKAFLDREELEGGDSITLAIRNGISSSLVQIAIFSKGYAESSWCLEELVLMSEQTDALFIPVFYDVEPKELRSTERGVYAEAFSRHHSKEKYADKAVAWEKALSSAAGISGFELRCHKDNLCEKIVSRVLQVVEEKRNSIPLHVAKYPVGLAELVQDFERSCLNKARDKVRRVGIFGLGGSGKTTLAIELFNKKRSEYHSSCFLSDVRKWHARGELHCLESQLLKSLFPKAQEIKRLEIRDKHQGMGQLKYHLERASHLRFLIILDDIDHTNQLDALLPEGMLSSGSLVIITTRDQSVLLGAAVSSSYWVKEMKSHHAKELFCRHALHRPDPPTAYKELVERFVEFCAGLPLSLQVVGAHVYARDEHYWKLELEKVKKVQPKDIMESLKISFDGLDKEEQQIFIDIACLFNGKWRKGLKNKAITIWEASGWSAGHAIQTLQDKCLVQVWELEVLYVPAFVMHDHLRDLGRQMADKLGPRLWKADILRSVEAKGFKQILAKTEGRCFHSFRDESLGWNCTYFIAETDLLWLEIENHGGNFKNIPSWIPLGKLQILSVKRVKNLWNTFNKQLQPNTQVSFQLRNLEISDCPSLQNLPHLIGMFSHLKVLEILNSLENTDVASFVQSLKQLSNLKSLELRSEKGGGFSGSFDLCKGRDSTNLGASTSSRMNSLQTITFDSLANISELVISGEICPRLTFLRVYDMCNLKEMHLNQLERLNDLQVVDCSKLDTIAGLSSLGGLQSLIVDGCRKLKTIPELSSLTELQCLVVANCPTLETISDLSHLSGLRDFVAFRCIELKSLPTFAHQRHMKRIQIRECRQLHSVEGVEESQELEILDIEEPDSGCAGLRNCIYGLKRLPSKYTLLTRKLVDKALSKLKANLFSEVIGDGAVFEIERGQYNLSMRGSLNAITIYALLVTSNGGFIQTTDGVYQRFPVGHEEMITVIFPLHDSEGSVEDTTINKGFKAIVKVEEEGKALTVLQRIVDRLYRGSMAPK